MKKINIEEKTRSLNEYRMANQNKSFLNGEIFEVLSKIGFNKNVAQTLLKCFPFEKMGTSKIYMMPKDPIHKSIIAAAYNKQNEYNKKWISKQKEENISEEKAIAILQKSGRFQIRECVGFDEDRFARENPELYQKYLVYEEVTL